jgi:V8-like Glu-specific endopeptidase
VIVAENETWIGPVPSLATVRLARQGRLQRVPDRESGGLTAEARARARTTRSEPGVQVVTRAQVHGTDNRWKEFETVYPWSSHMRYLALASNGDGEQWNCTVGLIHPFIALTSAHCTWRSDGKNFSPMTISACPDASEPSPAALGKCGSWNWDSFLVGTRLGWLQNRGDVEWDYSRVVFYSHNRNGVPVSIPGNTLPWLGTAQGMSDGAIQSAPIVVSGFPVTMPAGFASPAYPQIVAMSLTGAIPVGNVVEGYWDATGGQSGTPILWNVNAAWNDFRVMAIYKGSHWSWRCACNREWARRLTGDVLDFMYYGSSDQVAHDPFAWN